TVTFVDIAGLVRGAHKGQGLSNHFLTNIRNGDAIVMVLRAINDPNETQFSGPIDPVADAETRKTQLAPKDLETIEKRLGSLEGEIKAGKKESIALKPLLLRAKAELEQGRPIRTLPYSAEEKHLINQLQLLTAKPLLHILNVDEIEVGTVG